MTTSRFLFLPLAIAVFILGSCSSDDDGATTPVEQEPVGGDVNDGEDNATGEIDVDTDAGEDNIPDENGGPDEQAEETTIEVDANSLASTGCQNVVIVDEFAYAACDDGIEVVDLNTLDRNFVSLPADDISGDANFGVLFTQSGSTLQQLDLVDPMQPNPITTVGTNFSLFSGVSAANGVLAVSAGSGGSNTQVYTYDSNSLTLAISGIPLVDSRTGNPDVHVAATNNGAIAFYSQDLGAVANWGIQIVEFDTNGNIVNLPDVLVLTPGMFTGSFGVPFGPANFPLEGEFLNDRLFAAHFASDGIQVIDRSNSDALSLIPLGYEPTNIATDGAELFVVGVDVSTVDIVNPITDTVVDTLELPLQQPVGIAASETHLAIADRSAGLIIVTR